MRRAHFGPDGRLTSLRLDGCHVSAYGGRMTRYLALLILLASALILSGCGIRGDLKTPPPIWGAEAETAETTDTEETQTTSPVIPDDADSPGYGTEVVDQQP